MAKKQHKELDTTTERISNSKHVDKIIFPHQFYRPRRLRV